MDELRIGFQPDLFARLEWVTLAEYRDDGLTAHLGENLDFGAGRLYDHDFCFGAVIGDGEMFGADAVDHLAAVRPGRRIDGRQLHAARSGELGLAVHLQRAIRTFIAGEPMKPAT